VPVEFMSAGQLAAYGRYAEPPSVAQLNRFFHFDERDRALIDRRPAVTTAWASRCSRAL
jgi:hypothetical protein